jgi:hypothetical protein
LGGCGHVELEYRGELELEDGREGTFVYNASYDTGGHQIACVLTAIFYGGWCWSYLAMPMTDQENDIRRDTESFIERRFDGKAEVTYGRAHRLSWEDVRARAKVKVKGEPTQKVENPDADPEAKPAPKPEGAKPPPSSDPDTDDRNEADNGRKRHGWSNVDRGKDVPRESGLKFIFPNIFGIGAAFELLDETGGGVELGAAAVLGGFAGHYAQIEYAVNRWRDREVRVGLEYLRVRWRDHEYVPYRGLAVEITQFGGVGLEYAHLWAAEDDKCIDQDSNGDCYGTLDVLTMTYRI